MFYIDPITSKYLIIFNNMCYNYVILMWTILWIHLMMLDILILCNLYLFI